MKPSVSRQAAAGRAIFSIFAAVMLAATTALGSPLALTLTPRSPE
jgi:hypothetical protein